MNPKKLKQLKKRVKKAHQIVNEPSYIQELNTYRDLFDDFPPVKYLINNVLAYHRRCLYPGDYVVPLSSHQLVGKFHIDHHLKVQFD